MPSKRKWQPSEARRRVYRKRAAVPKYVPRSLRSQMLVTQRTFFLYNWQPGTAATQSFWRYLQFQVNQIPNWQNYQDLFDQYKINAIKTVYRPRYDNFDGANTTDTTVPGVTNNNGSRIHIVNDPYSTIIPTGIYGSASFNDFCEQGTVKTYEGNRPVTVYTKPTINISTENGNNMRRRASWLNTNVQSVHNLFHIYVQDNNFASNLGNSYDVFVTVYISLRNMR